jgi:signal transduction histidine kinase
LARIVATDTGIKIPQDALPLLSEEFSHSKNT